MASFQCQCGVVVEFGQVHVCAIQQTGARPEHIFGPAGTRIQLPAEPLAPTMAGMSLRDWFAGQAMVAVAPQGWVAGHPEAPVVLAEEAYRIADAMLAARTPKGDGE